MKLTVITARTLTPMDCSLKVVFDFDYNNLLNEYKLNHAKCLYKHCHVRLANGSYKDLDLTSNTLCMSLESYSAGYLHSIAEKSRLFRRGMYNYLYKMCDKPAAAYQVSNRVLIVVVFDNLDWVDHAW